MLFIIIWKVAGEILKFFSAKTNSNHCTYEERTKALFRI